MLPPGVILPLLNRLPSSAARCTSLHLQKIRGGQARWCAQGPRMVRDVFRLAKENEPAIIFIDEVDAIATARFDAQTGADRYSQCSDF